MASYTVTLYFNTGFNAVNIPDNTDLLNTATHLSLEDKMELAQNRNLGWILVPLPFSDVEDCDFVKIGDWFYSVVPWGITSTSDDVTRISLVADPITSAGGWKRVNNAVQSSFHIISGLTVRCTTKSDKYGEFDSEDPLTAPQQPLVLTTEWLTPPEHAEGEFEYKLQAGSPDPKFIESYVNLPKQCARQDGVTYTDPTTGQEISVPKTWPIGVPDEPDSEGIHNPVDVYETTDFYLNGTDIESSNPIHKSNGTQIYMSNDATNTYDGKTFPYVSDTIREGLSAVQGLGVVQGSIIHSWTVPKQFIGKMSIFYGLIGKEAKYDASTYESKATDIAQVVTWISGRKVDFSSTIKPNYANVKNKRALYGEYNKYGIMTCAGNSLEAKPEEVTSETEAPSITVNTDPRADGAPYYRFTTMNGNTEFWRNAIKGSPWENVPLQYEGASGNALTRMNFNNGRKVTNLRYEQNQTDYAYGQVQNAVSIAGSVASDLTPKISKNGISIDPIGAAADFAQGVSGMIQASVDNSYYQDIWKQERANELSQLYQQTDVYAPTVQFPYNADMLRDIENNGVLVYKYSMSDEDVKRVDKILTMYGYKTTEVLTDDNFFRRKHFDYVQCSGVAVTGLPKWWCDAIASMLSNGVRIWHEMPNTDAYNDNPIL